jgi:hypothetical protein
MPAVTIMSGLSVFVNSSLLDLERIVLPPAPPAVQFHDRIAFTGELHAGSRGEMTHDGIAVQHVDFVLAQAFQRLPLIFGQIDRAGDVSVGVIFRGSDIHDIHSLFFIIRSSLIGPVVNAISASKYSFAFAGSLIVTCVAMIPPPCL